MKELSIEQKVQRYDEAFKIAQELYNDPNSSNIGKGYVCTVFPELALSEDESIRKSLCKAIWTYIPTEEGKEYIAWLKKQGESLTDKVEPKFKNGQWIVWQDKCYKVNYNGCGYELVDQNGLSTSLEYGTIDENAHLWDITIDAKDGDVLVASDGSIFIFKEVVDLGCKHYIALVEEDGTIQVNDNFAHCWESVYGVCPATKEQRDTFMKAMADAGYTFDFEKKELKKIEQKSQRMISAEAKETLYDKPDWSEEDEMYLTHVTNAVKRYFANPWREDVIKWLKSLKDRLQSKQEYTEEAAETAAKKYRDYRETCGIKDQVLLQEIEDAYYTGYRERP